MGIQGAAEPVAISFHWSWRPWWARTSSHAHHIEALRVDVLRQASDPHGYRAFILRHDTWCTCMQVLHPAIFQPLEAARDANPFHELDIPDDSDSPATDAYAEAGRQVYERWQASVQHALEALADNMPGPGPQDPGTSSGAGIA
ncbi:hypothetical protein [Paracidovorax oryzae]|uniref:hypothetical protein n=1 Tax=Paracidovorax oryzae TaxID=862720 RepID=UPI0002D76714|nr:hypothetical protein [Paracidovorax oryzae]